MLSGVPPGQRATSVTVYRVRGVGNYIVWLETLV